MSVPVQLTGVPETMLWTLYHRAAEARRPDAVLDDPLAVELVERIDYPFAEAFGDSPWRARWQALRALRFDREIRRFAAARPGATVVALGEGLETQFWRVDDGRVRWVTVELPEAAAVQHELLPSSPRRRLIERSALDFSWMDEIDARDVLVTAQGLLMYFERDDADALIARCAERFPGGALVFDVIPRYLSAITRSQKAREHQGFVAPPMPWGGGRHEERRIAALSPRILDVHPLPLARGPGPLFGFVVPALQRTVPWLLLHRLFAVRFLQ